VYGERGPKVSLRFPWTPSKIPSEEFSREFVGRIRSDPPGRYSCLACLPRIALRSILGYFHFLPLGGMPAMVFSPYFRGGRIALPGGMSAMAFSPCFTGGRIALPGGRPLRKDCPRWCDLRVSRREAARIAQGGVRLGGRNLGLGFDQHRSAPEGRPNSAQRAGRTHACPLL
jgi:hypothetical protein